MSTTTKSADATDVAVGAAIRARRNVLRMSQTTLAERSGVTFQQIQKYEKGINRVAAGRLVQIAAALDVAVTDLLGSASADSNTAEGASAARKIDRISDPVQRQRVLKALDGILAMAAA